MGDSEHYCRWNLRFLAELSDRTLARLLGALSLALKQSPDSQALLGALLAPAVRRKLTLLHRCLGVDILPVVADGLETGCSRQLRRAHQLWVRAVLDLADDNELDVPRPDASGRQRLTGEIIFDAALDDAELAGRIASLVGCELAAC